MAEKIKLKSGGGSRTAAWNERVKLAATYVNAAAIAVFIFAIVRPFFDLTNTAVLTSAPSAGVGLALSILFHLCAQAILGFMRD